MMPIISFVPGEIAQGSLPHPLSISPEISKQIYLLYSLGVFQLLFLQGVVCCVVSLRAGTQFPLLFQALPELSLLSRL